MFEKPRKPGRAPTSTHARMLLDADTARSHQPLVEEEDVDAPEEVDKWAGLSTFAQLQRWRAGRRRAQTLPAPEPERPGPDSKEAKRAARRGKILQELLATERKYVSNLRTMCQLYIDPLRSEAERLHRGEADQVGRRL